MNMLIQKIKNEYLEYLTEEEIKSLDNLDEFTFKELVNDIWERYLNKNNSALVMSVSPLILMSSIIDEISQNKHFKVLNKDNSNTTFGEIGLIVNIDWTTEEEIYLPKDLLIEKNINPIFGIVGVYFIDYGEGKLSVSYEIAEKLTDIVNQNSVTTFNRDNYKPNDEYYTYIAKCVLTEYAINRNINLSKIDELLTEYGKRIVEAYKTSKKGLSYNYQSFMSKMYDYLDYDFKSIIETNL